MQPALPTDIHVLRGTALTTGDLMGAGTAEVRKRRAKKLENL
jgi:hypothetical protein